MINDILVFDNYRSTIEIDEIFYDLELADTAGQVDYEQVRLVSKRVYATKAKKILPTSKGVCITVKALF